MFIIVCSDGIVIIFVYVKKVIIMMSEMELNK